MLYVDVGSNDKMVVSGVRRLTAISGSALNALYTARHHFVIDTPTPRGGVPQTGDVVTFELLGYPPYTSDEHNRRGPEFVYNQRRSYMENAYTLFTSFDWSHRSIPDSERFVKHYNVQGAVTTGYVPGTPVRFFAEGDEYAPNDYISYIDKDGQDVFYTSSPNGQVTALTDHPLIDKVLLDLQEGIGFGGPFMDINRYADEVYYFPVGIRWQRLDNSVVIHIAEYRIQMDGLDYKHSIWFRRYRSSAVPTGAVLDYGPLYDVSAVVNIRDTYEKSSQHLDIVSSAEPYAWTSALENEFNSLPLVHDDYAWASLPSYTPYPYNYFVGQTIETPGQGFEATVGTDYIRPWYYSGHDNSFMRFNELADELLLDGLSAAHLSCVDAIDTHTERIKLSHLESMTDLYGVLSTVDAVKTLDAVRKLPMAKSKQGILLKSVLDLLTSATLIYSFGLAPSYKDAVKVSRSAEAFVHKHWGYLNTPRTIYGTVVFENVSKPNWPYNVNVEVRSKIRMNPIPDLVLTVLPLQAANLLPGMSDFWAAMPFSFVVDWLFPVGGLTSLADDAMRIMALDVDYCTHSVTIERDFGQDLRGALSCRPGSRPGAGLRYRLHERWTTSSIPPVLPSSLVSDDLVSNGPSWEVAGSLVYQVLR